MVATTFKLRAAACNENSSNAIIMMMSSNTRELMLLLLSTNDWKGVLIRFKNLSVVHVHVEYNF